jgi:hypothetical protein
MNAFTLFHVVLSLVGVGLGRADFGASSGRPDASRFVSAGATVFPSFRETEYSTVVSLWR